jgi:hypothetical protein
MQCPNELILHQIPLKENVPRQYHNAQTRGKYHGSHRAKMAQESGRYGNN